jgi:hypothetical protein
VTVETQYIPTNVLTKWTFESTPIREWVESHLEGRVLNACCGESLLDYNGSVLRNDLDDSVDSDHSLDVAELPTVFEESLFDCIVFDPPWTLYQANLRYEGRHVHSTGGNIESEIAVDELPLDLDEDKSQVGHARLAKDGFDYLLREGGIVIQLTYHGTCMPNRLGYDQEERVIFDPIGENKAVIGSVDRKQ